MAILILDDVMFIQLFALVIMNMISTTHPHATEFTHDIPIIRDVLSAIKHNDHKTVTSMYIIVYIYIFIIVYIYIITVIKKSNKYNKLVFDYFLRAIHSTEIADHQLDD